RFFSYAPHLGRRLGAEDNKSTTGQKRSLKRREIMFKGDPWASRAPLTSTQQGPAGWNEDRHKADLEWAERVTARFPYYLEEKRLELAARDANAYPPSCPGCPANTLSPLTQPPAQMQLAPAIPSASYQLSPAPAPLPVSQPPLQPKGQPTHILTLGDGRRLVLTADDVPAPPAVSSANDLAALNRMWDDVSEYWQNDSKLRIQGVPTAIV
ncbi:hypothetical protein CVT26_008882, partial [Gymnopilus dilepis]